MYRENYLGALKAANLYFTLITRKINPNLPFSDNYRRKHGFQKICPKNLSTVVSFKTEINFNDVEKSLQ